MESEGFQATSIRGKRIEKRWKCCISVFGVGRIFWIRDMLLLQAGLQYPSQTSSFDVPDCWKGNSHGCSTRELSKSYLYHWPVSLPSYVCSRAVQHTHTRTLDATLSRGRNLPQSIQLLPSFLPSFHLSRLPPFLLIHRRALVQLIHRCIPMQAALTMRILENIENTKEPNICL